MISIVFLFILSSIIARCLLRRKLRGRKASPCRRKKTKEDFFPFDFLSSRWPCIAFEVSTRAKKPTVLRLLSSNLMDYLRGRNFLDKDLSHQIIFLFTWAKATYQKQSSLRREKLKSKRKYSAYERILSKVEGRGII